MFCNNCGTQNPDGAKFCNSCGQLVTCVAPTVKPVIPVSSNSIKEELPEPYSTNIVKKALFAVAIILGIIMFMQRGGVGFIGLVIICFTILFIMNEFTKRNISIKEIEEIKFRNENGREMTTEERYQLKCPRCKSTNISTQANTVTTGAKNKTTYGENINPLRPFTHVNQKGKTTYNTATKTIHICNNCGKTF